MEQLLQDFRFAVRSLRKSRAFSAIAFVTLAVGMGAVTAMFGVVDGVLLKPLRYRDPHHTFRAALGRSLVMDDRTDNQHDDAGRPCTRGRCARR